MKRALPRLPPVAQHFADAQRQRFDVGRGHELHAQYANAHRQGVAGVPNLRDERMGQAPIQVDRRRRTVDALDLVPIGCDHVVSRAG